MKSYNIYYKPIAFAPSELVLLSTKNLKLKLLSKKLAFRFISLFIIANIVGKQVYYLYLPTNYYIYNVFNISYLKPYIHHKSESLPKMLKSIIIDNKEQE